MECEAGLNPRGWCPAPATGTADISDIGRDVTFITPRPNGGYSTRTTLPLRRRPSSRRMCGRLTAMQPAVGS
jgi:hypothetical protein